MSLIKVKGNNTFEWKLDINQETASYWTGEFSVDEYDFELVSDCEFDGCPRLRQFRLICEDSKNFPVYYTFSILDREGHVFVTSKGKAMSNGSTVERSLMIIDVSYLTVFNLTKSGTYTVRFSLNCNLDTHEESYPTKARATNVADKTTPTNLLITKDSSTNTDGGDTSLLETLSKDFSTFYENKADTDCVLKVSDDQFNVHRAILSARSSVFSAMFHHDTAENRSGEVNILDVKATALSNFLYYVYSGKIRGLTPDTAASMYTVADKYDLPELRTECFEFLKCNLTMDNFCEVALLAHTHGEMELEDQVVWFIEEKLDEVLASNAWQQFLKDKTLLASKLLTSALMFSKKKVLRSISK